MKNTAKWQCRSPCCGCGRYLHLLHRLQGERRGAAAAAAAAPRARKARLVAPTAGPEPLQSRVKLRQPWARCSGSPSTAVGRVCGSWAGAGPSHHGARAPPSMMPAPKLQQWLDHEPAPAGGTAHQLCTSKRIFGSPPLGAAG